MSKDRHRARLRRGTATEISTKSSSEEISTTSPSISHGPRSYPILRAQPHAMLCYCSASFSFQSTPQKANIQAADIIQRTRERVNAQVHSPVHGPVQSPQSRFCSIPISQHVCCTSYLVVVLDLIRHPLT